MNTAEDTTTAALTLDAVTIRYGRHIAVQGVSMTVPQGSVYALLGRNGAGKTSLVRVLLGERKPHRGEAHLLGSAVWRHRRQALASVGVVPEKPDAPPDVSLDRIANFCRPLYPLWDQPGWEARLERDRIPRNRPFGALSRGQQGLAQLALALASQPRLLVLDDPTLGLDVAARRSFFDELIGDLHDRGTTVFLTTHDLDGVERFADRVGILRQGRLLFDDALEGIKSRFQAVRFPGEQDLDRVSTALRGLAVQQVRQTPWGVEAIVEEPSPPILWPAGSETASLSLEEIFLAVTHPTPGGAS